MRVCVGIHSDYRLWYSASSLSLVYYATIITAERGREEAKEGVKSERMPSQSKRYHLVKMVALQKSQEYNTTITEISREGGGRSAPEERRNTISDGLVVVGQWQRRGRRGKVGGYIEKRKRNGSV